MQGATEPRNQKEVCVTEEAVHCEKGPGLPPQDRNISTQNAV